jgi:hypothetical protein
VEQPALDVLAGRALVVAGRQAVEIDRARGAPGAGVVGQRGAGVEGDGEGLVHHANLLGQQAVLADVLVGLRLDARDRGHGRGLAEQVGKALLRPQVLLDRQWPPDRERRLDFAVLGLEHREDAGFLGQPRQRMVSCEAAPQPSGQGTRMWM